MFSSLTVVPNALPAAPVGAHGPGSRGSRPASLTAQGLRPLAPRLLPLRLFLLSTPRCQQPPWHVARGRWGAPVGPAVPLSRTPARVHVHTRVSCGPAASETCTCTRAPHSTRGAPLRAAPSRRHGTGCPPQCACCCTAASHGNRPRPCRRGLLRPLPSAPTPFPAGVCPVLPQPVWGTPPSFPSVGSAPSSDLTAHSRPPPPPSSWSGWQPAQPHLMAVGLFEEGAQHFQ